MAKSKKRDPVLLGYDDEYITEKQKSAVGYWCNKIGGVPDWPVKGVSPPSCLLCGLNQPLVVQIYAPLENSPYHRTLFVFACINPNCWNHSDSWTCYRSQVLDLEPAESVQPTASAKTNTASDWCTEATKWDDDNGNFENGNVLEEVNCSNFSDNESDDDSSSLSAAVGNLSVDECNANWGNYDKIFGAVGKQMAPVATAEIEKEESEVVSIDTPTAPQKDLLALLQESTPVPYHFKAREKNQNHSTYFTPIFISVAEESNYCYTSDHIRDLIQEYQKTHEDIISQGISSYKEESGDVALEEYEKAVPAHGDKMFHQFLTRIQLNPGHILRYSRESEGPLLLYPLQERPSKCKYCNADLVFEMQLLPTLIPKLKFPDEDLIRVEFGTVLIFTCQKSCWASDDLCRKEEIIVQIEKT